MPIHNHEKFEIICQIDGQKTDAGHFRWASAGVTPVGQFVRPGGGGREVLISMRLKQLVCKTETMSRFLFRSQHSSNWFLPNTNSWFKNYLLISNVYGTFGNSRTVGRYLW